MSDLIFEDDYLILLMVHFRYIASGSCVFVGFVDGEQLFCYGCCQPLLTGDWMTEHYRDIAWTLMVS